MLGKALIAGVITLVIIGTSGQMLFPPKPILFYNPSYSAQVGWYKLRAVSYTHLTLPTKA